MEGQISFIASCSYLDIAQKPSPPTSGPWEEPLKGDSGSAEQTYLPSPWANHDRGIREVDLWTCFQKSDLSPGLCSPHKGQK